jgi:hypothetical protein
MFKKKISVSKLNCLTLYSSSYKLTFCCYTRSKTVTEVYKVSTMLIHKHTIGHNPQLILSNLNLQNYLLRLILM